MDISYHLRYFLSACFVLAPHVGYAKEQIYQADYEIFLGGLSLIDAKVNFDTTSDDDEDDDYRISTRLHASGVLEWFEQVNLVAHSEGRIAQSKLIPRQFATARMDDQEHKTIKVTFRENGTPLSYQANYESNNGGEELVNPLPTNEINISVVDPLSAFFRYYPENIETACAGDLFVSDGKRVGKFEFSIDKIYDAGAHEFPVTGAVIRCMARFIPKHGYRASFVEAARQAAEDDEYISFTLARMKDTQFIAPLRIEVPTTYGWLIFKTNGFFAPIETPQEFHFTLKEEEKATSE